jgi:hypothetical protein
MSHHQRINSLIRILRLTQAVIEALLRCEEQILLAIARTANLPVIFPGQDGNPPRHDAGGLVRDWVLLWENTHRAMEQEQEQEQEGTNAQDN